MKESKVLELLMQIEPGMVLVNKKDFSLLIVKNLGDGIYLCISEDNKIRIIDLLKELKSEEHIAGIYSLPESDEDMCWNNGAIQKIIWLNVPKEKTEDKPELPPFLQMLEELLTILSDDSPTERVKIVPFEEDGKIGLRMIIRVPKK